MSYPLIILGAGASAGYLTNPALCPPITKDLVNPERFDIQLLNKYPEAGDLLSQIEVGVNERGKSFEGALQEINQRSANVAVRQEQLVALQFYLRGLFEKVSKNCHRINHYKTLQGHLTDYTQNKACIVSFNYDSLFEGSFPKNPWCSIDSYVEGKIKLIKLHGSHDWVYLAEESRPRIMRFGSEEAYDFYKAFPNHLINLRKEGGHPYHEDELDSIGLEIYKLPAIAIPLPSKEDLIICPNAHIKALEKELQEVDRILILGWQAADPFLLNLIRDRVKKDTRFTLVSRTLDSARTLTTKVALATELQGAAYGGGFRKFIESEDCHNFFSK